MTATRSFTVYGLMGGRLSPLVLRGASTRQPLAAAATRPGQEEQTRQRRSGARGEGARGGAASYRARGVVVSESVVTFSQHPELREYFRLSGTPLRKAWGGQPRGIPA